jgi:hypothetical protein
LGELFGLAYLSQPIPTKAGQFYELSFEFDNPSNDPPSEIVVEWNSNPSSPNVIFDQTNPPASGYTYTNMQFLVEAASTNTTLSFGNDNAGYGFFLLDNVSVVPVAVPMPNVQTATVANGQFQVTWASYPGVSYQIQYTSDLSSTWSNVGSPITASGSTTSTSESIGSSPQGFYRVMISQ